MNLQDLVQYLRESCLVDNPEIVQDSEFIALTDKQLEGIIHIASFKVKINLADLTESNLYLLMLIAKKEVYYRLATLSAPLYTIKSETGELMRSDRFSHYYQLINSLQEEYEHYMKELEANTDVSNTDSYGGQYTKGEVFLASRYHSLRNYNHSTNPTIKITMDNVYTDKLELSWKLKSINRFKEYLLYINKENPIIDEYNKNEISPNSKVILNSYDIHQNKFRISDLEPNCIYHIAIVVKEQNNRIGYDEIQVVTKEVI